MSNQKSPPSANICGHRIKIARVEANMNQLELATLLSTDYDLIVGQNAISRMEKGERFVRDYEIIILAKALNKHPMWLLFGDQILKEFVAKDGE